ncbi:hypothetical protein F5X99DRAFT_406726 [Biscogniauxia marginata]|nr:hypothetical protein F5X99DRAFT_406726 [Biscogniauxia marginata]
MSAHKRPLPDSQSSPDLVFAKRLRGIQEDVYSPNVDTDNAEAETSESNSDGSLSDEQGPDDALQSELLATLEPVDEYDEEEEELKSSYKLPESKEVVREEEDTDSTPLEEYLYTQQAVDSSSDDSEEVVVEYEEEDEDEKEEEEEEEGEGEEEYDPETFATSTFEETYPGATPLGGQLGNLIRITAQVLNFMIKARTFGINPLDADEVQEAAKGWEEMGETPESIAKENADVMAEQLMNMSVRELVAISHEAMKLKHDLGQEGIHL